MKKTLLLLLVVYGYSSWAQCPATVTISGIYTTTYTGSNSWIDTSGSTTIPAGANVTLDANPLTNGYVQLNPGFETISNAEFLAIVVTPCSLLNVNQNTIEATFTVFPNPIRDIVNIKSETVIVNTQIFDINGKLISNRNHDQENVILNIENFSNGIYLLKITTVDTVKTLKIIKE